MNMDLTINQPKRFGFNTHVLPFLLVFLFAMPMYTLVGLWIVTGLIMCVQSLSHGTYLALPLGVFIVGAGVGVTFVFMPVFQLNFYLRHLIRKVRGQKQPVTAAYDCQISFSPRLRHGLVANLGDSDDIGRFEITDDGIRFDGEIVQLTLPFAAIDSISRSTSDWRAMWAQGRKSRIATRGLDGISSFEIGERQSHTYWGSVQISDEIAFAFARGLQLSHKQSTRDCSLE